MKTSKQLQTFLPAVLSNGLRTVCCSTASRNLGLFLLWKNDIFLCFGETRIQNRISCSADRNHEVILLNQLWDPPTPTACWAAVATAA